MALKTHTRIAPVRHEAQSGNALAKYEAACRAVAEASSVDEVREISALAEAQRAYAKQANNRQMEIDAAEIRIRAERRLGEIMEQQKATVGFNQGGRPKTGVDQTPVSDERPATLAEAGIDKNLAKRARTLAAVPEAKFEKMLADKRDRDNTRVVLDPEFQAEAEAAARDLEIERDERIAMSGTGHLVEENNKLRTQLALLNRRLAAMLEKIKSLQYLEKMWKERAVAAGWKPRADA